MQEWKSEKNLKFFGWKFIQKEKLFFFIDKSGYFQVCLCFVLPTAAGLP